MGAHMARFVADGFAVQAENRESLARGCPACRSFPPSGLRCRRSPRARSLRAARMRHGRLRGHRSCLRTFEYEGKKVEMFRHLKIGADDDATRAIRVHFHGDAERET